MAKDSDVAALMAAMAWSKDKLEKLRRQSRDEFIRRNLRAIAYALDPQTNPKLTAVFEKYREA